MFSNALGQSGPFVIESSRVPSVPNEMDAEDASNAPKI